MLSQAVNHTGFILQVNGDMPGHVASVSSPALTPWQASVQFI